MSNDEDNSSPSRNLPVARQVIVGAGVVVTLIGFGLALANVGRDSDSQSLTIEGDNNGTVVGRDIQSDGDADAELDPPAEAGAESGATTSTTVASSTTQPASPTTSSSVPPSRPGVWTIEEFERACAALEPTEVPLGGRVDYAENGCPIMTNALATPFQEDQWKISLTAGQEISYTFDHNIMNGFPRVSFDFEDGPSVFEMVDARDESGRFVVEETGHYVVTFEGDDDLRRSYTLALYDISLPVREQKSFSSAAYDCVTEPLFPSEVPPGGEVQPADNGCPALSGALSIPFQKNQWVLNLTAGQEVSYVFDHNIMNRFPLVSLDGADGLNVFSMEEALDEIGRFTVKEAGEYVLTLEGDGDRRRTYDISFVLIG